MALINSIKRAVASIKVPKLKRPSLQKIVTKSVFPLILILISVTLAITNYTPNTYLSGWDALHPEFDLNLNFLRTFFGVFRTEQGLGALAAHAHMVELPKIFLYYVLNIVFPQDTLRYLYTFACLIAGPLGMFYFLNKVVIKKELPSFLGALFYLLNIGTYQTFLVPFEMFTTAYATLPFLFLSTSLVLAKYTKKHYLFLLIALFFASSAAYAPTLWYIMMACLLLYFFPLVALKRTSFPGIRKRFIVILLTIFLVNAFWLLPNIYFAINGAGNVTEANINKLFSQEAFLKNKEFGNLFDILQLKIFYFDWNIFDYTNNSFVQLTSAFQNHLKLTYIQPLVYLFACSIVGGFLYSIWKFRKYSIGILIMLFIVLLFMFNDNPPTGFIFNVIREHVPFFKEAFRFPENKIFNLFLFLVAIYFGLFQDFIIKSFSRLKMGRKLAKVSYSLLISFGLILYLLPAFSGNFIHPGMRIEIPKAYFELFNALKKEDQGRVANLPIHSPWGWVYHNWYEKGKPSFQGAGFLYFGVKQSLLERDFDRWEPTNEQYYREMRQAIYSKDKDKLSAVLSKYAITHILLDESVIAPGTEASALFYQDSKQLLESLVAAKKLQKGQRFGTFLTLYRTSEKKSILRTLPKVTAANTINGAFVEDGIYLKNGDYANFATNNFFPFEHFMDNEFKTKIAQLGQDNETVSLFIPKANYKIGTTNLPDDHLAASVVATKNVQFNSASLRIYPYAPLFNNASLIKPINVELPDTSSFQLFSVNEKVFSLTGITNNSPTAIGNTFLIKNNNTVTTYSMIGGGTEYELSQLPITFSYCDSQQNGTLSAIIDGRNLSITTDGKKDICLNLPLYFLPYDGTTNLVTLQFATAIPDLTACLTENSSPNCSQSVEIVSNNAKSLIFAATYETLTQKRLILNIPRGNPKVSFEGMQVVTYPGQTSASLERDTTVDPGGFQQITLPAPQDKSFVFEPNKDGSLKNDCIASSISSKKFVKNGQKQAYSYTSQSGSFCDHASFPDLSHDYSYLVFVESRNVTGLPLNLCITNYTSRNCDINAKLTTQKGVAKDAFFLPTSDKNGRGYDVNIENTGVKGTPAINELYSIRFVPAPYSILASISTGYTNSYTFPGSLKKFESLTPNSFSFTTDGKPAYVNLAYSYQKGFTLYKIQCSNSIVCTIKSFLPFVFGEKVESHRLTNRWSNGWIVPQGLLETNYVIAYFPQYLQFLGFLFLLLPILNLPNNTFLHLLNFAKKSNTFFDRKSESLKQQIHLRLHVSSV